MVLFAWTLALGLALLVGGVATLVAAGRATAGTSSETTLTTLGWLLFGFGVSVLVATAALAGTAEAGFL